jgi:hypothetical protein
VSPIAAGDVPSHEPPLRVVMKAVDLDFFEEGHLVLVVQEQSQSLRCKSIQRAIGYST